MVILIHLGSRSSGAHFKDASMKLNFALRFCLIILLLAQACYAEETRAKSLTHLQSLGFKVSPSLPVERSHLKKLRPESEIRMRLDALQTLVLWVVAPADKDVTFLRQRALEGELKDWLTGEEKAIFRLDQADAQQRHLESIGWQMENMWALGWVLGFQTQPALEGQIQGPLARDLVFEFCADSTEKKLRNLQEVKDLEDLFYCAHNAVRNAQQGSKTVPEGYDPKADGGGVHERRHALTWCLSPGVKWEDTDLST
jgi:Domain of unknown function (DUF4272)